MVNLTRGQTDILANRGRGQSGILHKVLVHLAGMGADFVVEQDFHDVLQVFGGRSALRNSCSSHVPHNPVGQPLAFTQLLFRHLFSTHALLPIHRNTAALETRPPGRSRTLSPTARLTRSVTLPTIHRSNAPIARMLPPRPRMPTLPDRSGDTLSASDRALTAHTTLLRDAIRAAVEQLLQLRTPLIAPVWPTLEARDVYSAACRFILRLVVLRCAGSRAMLPAHIRPDGSRSEPERHSPNADADPARTNWLELLRLFSHMHRGGGAPNSHRSTAEASLFAPGDPSGTPVQRALALLESPERPLEPSALSRLLRTVAHLPVPDGAGAHTSPHPIPIDFTQLDGPAIGALYEGLLDYELHRVGPEPVLFVNVAGTPALSLDRLEQMDDSALRALLRGTRRPSDTYAYSPVAAQDDAWRRAIRWAERAVRLTTPPHISTTKTAQLARGLISDLKRPGKLYLVRWGGTRKGTGSFYTEPGLTEPTVERTLEPLLRTRDGNLHSPEAILNLKVCDPAMGGGSFLVAALNVLTRALVESLHIHERVTRTDPNVEGAGGTVLIDGQIRAYPPGPAGLHLAARQQVAIRCLYGVDIDPLAAALARAALWVELRDPDLPIAALHQHLRWGNALVGASRALFWRYPLRALQRDSPDRAHNGIHHTRGTWHRALIAHRKEATRMWAEAPTHASQPESLRTAPTQALHTAFDTWCALWFWPLDQLASAPTPQDFAEPHPATLAQVHSIARRHRFFHWELAFPEVFAHSNGGFDAMVGNPPWETRKPNSKEFFSKHDPLYRDYTRPEALAQQRKLFAEDSRLETAWLRYKCGFKDHGNFVRHCAEPFGPPPSRLSDSPPSNLPFRHQGSADLNLYKLFVEQAYARLRPGGQLGLIVPSSLYTDKGARALRQLLLNACRWRWLYGFENRNKLFDIHRSFKFCVLIAEKGGRTTSIQTAFMRRKLSDWAMCRGLLRYPARTIEAFSPASLSLLELQSTRDLEVLETLHQNGVPLGHSGPDGWALQYARELDTTNDSARFVTRQEAERNGYHPDPYGHWCRSDGASLLPLYEGRMLGALNFSAKAWMQGRGRRAVWQPVSWSDHRIQPQFFLRAADATGPKVHTGPKVAYMRIGSSTNSRTVISTYLRDVPASDSVFYFLPSHAPVETGLALTGVFSTFAYDWAVRTRLGGLNLSEFLMVETPLPRSIPHEMLRLVLALACGGPQFAREWMQLCGPGPTPWRKLWAVTPHERLRLRCMIDAIVASLFGLEKADFAWILKDCDHPCPRLAHQAFCRQLDPKGFWRIDRDKPAVLRQSVLSLAAFEALEACIQRASGQRDQGIARFCAQNHGEGWMIPEHLSLSCLGLQRTQDPRHGTETPSRKEPVRARLGPRFFEWQLEQTAEQSWTECTHHAELLRGR